MSTETNIDDQLAVLQSYLAGRGKSARKYLLRMPELRATFAGQARRVGLLEAREQYLLDLLSRNRAKWDHGTDEELADETDRAMGGSEPAAAKPEPGLLPCPFCGGVATFGYRGQPAQAAFGACTVCKARGPETQAGMTGSGSISSESEFWLAAGVAWNMRKPKG